MFEMFLSFIKIQNIHIMRQALNSNVKNIHDESKLVESGIHN